MQRHEWAETAKSEKGVTRNEVTGRRTWDRAHWQAVEGEGRSPAADAAKVDKGKREPLGEKGWNKPRTEDTAFVTERKDRIAFEQAIGRQKNVILETSHIGFHCKVCDVTLKDNRAYLDHLNGKKHNRNCGLKMQVKRATPEDVRRRLAELTKEKALKLETKKR